MRATKTAANNAEVEKVEKLIKSMSERPMQITEC